MAEDLEKPKWGEKSPTISMAVRVVQVRVPCGQVDKGVTGRGNWGEEGGGGQAHTAKDGGEQGGHRGAETNKNNYNYEL